MNNELTPEQRHQEATNLIKAAEQGVDVQDADPRMSSIEAVIFANRIRRTGKQTIDSSQLTI